MDVIEAPAAFREACDGARGGGATVGLVPTMGALHDGHASLIRRARAECGFVALSIFVNPLQFDLANDLAKYPRTFDADLEMARRLGVDAVLAPTREAMYPEGEPAVTVDPGPLGDRFEGASRPGHFRGVLTIVAKLFHLLGRGTAYFGEKDAQQLALVKRMAGDLDFAVAVVACPTVREPDGLALSSRNVRLTPEQRDAAPVLFEALSDAATLVRQGERSTSVLKAEMARRIGAVSLARLDYVAIVDDETWEEPDELEGPARALVAARFGDVRLIDNLVLPPPPASASVHNGRGPSGGA